MNTNDFVPFCYEDTGTNLEEQAAYLVDPDRTIGNQPGVASSQLNNKALRQGTAVANAVAQYVSNFLNANVLDDGNAAQLQAQMFGTFTPLSPVLTNLLSGTGTWNPTYMFFVASANATAGATYTNNSNTFTVVNTISAGVILQTTGNGLPASGSGTLTLATGTGDSTISYYSWRSAGWLELEMVGGGAGGCGGGAGGGGSGSNGGNTTFGTSLLVANGGNAGTGGSYTPPAGGTASLGVGPVGIALQGAYGGGNISYSNITTVGFNGGVGASTPFGGAGSSGPYNTIGGSAIPNTGSGGGGGGVGGAAGDEPGLGGAAGGYIKCLIYSPSPTYPYAVGTGGSGGSAGGSGQAGGSGGSGLILITEKFQ
jgi:hypothetical protein